MSGGLPAVSGPERLRARRWDAIVLGSGTAALVSAARLGAAGHRVLVVEEDAARGLHPGLREPFFMAGARDGGILDVCLRELNIPLIDQRRIASERLAYQVVSPKFRVDVGEPATSADELACWGLCDAEHALPLVRALTEAGEAERKVMREAPLVRLGRRLSIARAATPGSHVRGLPAEVASAPAELRPMLAAQASALANLADSEPGPEARARLLASALAGGAGFGDGPPWLLELLRRRVEAVYGEFRSIAGRFELVSLDNQPGITVENRNELWVGRVLVVAVDPQALSGALVSGVVPEMLARTRGRRRRLAIHLRAHADVVPRGMSARLIVMQDERHGGPKDRVVSVTAFASTAGGDEIDLIARMAVEPDADIEACEDEIEHRVSALMPFSQGRIKRIPQRRPSWDDDGWLEDPGPGGGWPAEVDLRVSGRPPVYRLDRSEIACLGLEGDLLLGLRAGDAIAHELG